MQIHLVGLRIDARACDAATQESLREKWSEFVGTAEDDSRADLGEPDFALRAVADESVVRLSDDPEVHVTKRGEVFDLTRHDFEATWDPRTRQAVVRYGFLSSFSSFLRVLLSVVLRERGGVLLHAASVSVAGHSSDAPESLLFPGVSGTGKSTISGLAAPRGILSDEISGLRVWRGRPHAFPTPFWGDLVRERAADPAPLRNIVILSRGGSTSLAQAGRADAFAALLEGALFFDENAPLEEKRALADIVNDLSGRAPCIRLRFDLPSNPWPLLDP